MLKTAVKNHLRVTGIAIDSNNLVKGTITAGQMKNTVYDNRPSIAAFLFGRLKYLKKTDIRKRHIPQLIIGSQRA